MIFSACGSLPGKNGLELFHTHARPGAERARRWVLGVDGGDDDAVEAVVEAALEQQRHIDDGQRGAVRFSLLARKGRDPRADQWMNCRLRAR